MAAASPIVTGEAIDLREYDTCDFVLATGQVISGDSVSFIVQESDDDSNWAAINAGEVLGDTGGWAANAGYTRRHFAYIGYMRYVRVVITATGLSGAARIPISAVAILGRRRLRPVR